MSAFQWIGLSEDRNKVELKKVSDQFVAATYATAEWRKLNQELIRTAIVLDTETTGLSKNNDEIIEIAIRSFEFNKQTGELLTLKDSYSSLQEPSKPLNRDTQIITGLTDYDLRGKKIDWQKVDSILATADIILAHNAAFDRPFVDKKSAVSTTKPWGCSVKQIEWIDHGFGSAKLELLSVYHGFFTEAHRAMNDVNALLYLLTMKVPNKEFPYLNELLTNARKPIVRVYALNSPFETKDQLKERGYYWDQNLRTWTKSIQKEETEAEVAWLESLIYKGNFKGQVKEIPVIENFK